MIGRLDNQNIPEDYLAEFHSWKKTISPDDQNIEYARPHYSLFFLPGQYTSKIAEYNKQHATKYSSYDEIELPSRVPVKESLTRNDWIRFVRNEIKLKFIRLDDSLEKPFRDFIVEQYSSISEFNRLHNTSLSDFSQVPFPRNIYDAEYLSVDFEKFVKSEKFCPPESLSIYDPNDEFKKYLAGKYGKVPDDYPGLGPVQAATEWKDCLENAASVRWELTKRNYIQVFDYLGMHGNGFINTIIFCALAILTKLIVNPMAAYALSRFNLPSTYKILLFCMATMAFPHEVTMIPSFLLLKKFPLYPLLVTVVVTLVSFKILEKIMPSVKEGYKALFSLFLGLLAGAVFMPQFLPGLTTVSLLNTFAALVLPGMANGYSIFLLKGFFDSMPKELYEAAEIDGAGEWTKFWLLTMNLSKPILAVLALAAFTHAYSAFMQALIIIPDQKMWTIMIWVYQLQAQSAQPVVYASLVIAAIPTMLIFVLCQNVIMRGIVVPTEK
jgi:multiple sugar transport system permease protein